jgi:peptidoglycan/xylan/chitin deacetylase (PgdA/CDA1 family)
MILVPSLEAFPTGVRFPDVRTACETYTDFVHHHLGQGIYVCNNPGTVAITYDDGPYVYTEGVMKLFEARGAHATFFITGNNLGKGAIDENWAGVIKKMYDNGHQVASHVRTLMY